MNKINVSTVPSQIFQVVLDNQDCTIKLYQRGGRLFMDLAVGDIDVFVGAICLNGVSIAQFKSPYFKGTLHFYDTLGTADPLWGGLGIRFILLYASEGEMLPKALVI